MSPHLAVASGREDGFTLVELLVALALLSLSVTLIVYAIAGVGGALRSSELERPPQSLAGARSFVRQVVEQARPVQRTFRDGKKSRLLDGSSVEVSFTSGYAAAGQYQGMYLTRLFLKPSNGTGEKLDFVVEQVLYRRGKDGEIVTARAPRPHMLIDGVEAISLRYLDRSASGGSQWLDEWTSPDRMPAAISIDIRFPKNEALSWPTLVAELMLAE